MCPHNQITTDWEEASRQWIAMKPTPDVLSAGAWCRDCGCPMPQRRPSAPVSDAAIQEDLCASRHNASLGDLPCSYCAAIRAALSAAEAKGRAEGATNEARVWANFILANERVKEAWWKLRNEDQEFSADDAGVLAASLAQSGREQMAREIAAFLRAEADIPPNAFLKVDHAMLLANVRALADRIEAKR